MQVEVKNKGKTPEQMVAELQAFKQRLPADIGNMAVRFFKDNITERQGFLNTSLELWQKGRRQGFRQSHHLLINKGNLVRGINYSLTLLVFSLAWQKRCKRHQQTMYFENVYLRFGSLLVKTPTKARVSITYK